MEKMYKYVDCQNCKNMWDCERTYLGGCTDGEEFKESEMDNLEHGWIVAKDRETEVEKMYVCDWCGEDICEGDEYYDIDGTKICCECISGCRKTA